MTGAEKEKLLNYFKVHVPGLLPAIEKGFGYIEEQERLFNLGYPRNRNIANIHSNRANGAEWILAHILRHIY